MDIKEKYDSIIFDLDGTLWDSSKPICEAWNIILDKHPEIVRVPITIDELGGCMGLPMYDIAAKLFPLEKSEVRNALMDELCIFENGYLEKTGGVLFPKLKETLEQLKKKYRLFIVSNCQDGYIEAFLQYSKLGEYFKDFTCPAYTGRLKGENIRIIMERNGLSEAVYVGDTQGDANSCKEAEIPMIYAAYGFGEVEKADASIQSFDELLDMDFDRL